MNSMALCRRWFTRFFIYNLIFLCLQFEFIVYQSNSFIQAIPLPSHVYYELLLTLCIQPCLYLLLSAVQTICLWGCMQRQNKYSAQRLHPLIWCLFVCAVLITNAYFFPLSAFSQLFLSKLPSALLLTGLIVSVVPLLLLLFNALWFIARAYPKLISMMALSIIICITILSIKPTPIISTHTKPNVILIGVDSLPPIAINAKNTPTLSNFIQQSVLFKETISPLARTYPAWATILTGLYPHHHHARYNLMPPARVKSDKSIAWRVQTEGYKTIFATDDRRFNNMGEEFGFQQIIGPKTGINDIILGTFNDFPLSNLLINLPLARWIFPYNHMNRASYFSYYPKTFDKALQHTLEHDDKSAPLFLAVHFTLPHWPYAFAPTLPAEVKDEYSVLEREQLFSIALHHADKQVAHLLDVLQDNGYLKNSLVILLSDHGETLYTKGSRQTQAQSYQGTSPSVLSDYFKRKTSTTLDRSAGHGSDLLSTDQYHCVLACKIYQHGQLVTTPNIIKTRVALIDLTPTISQFLNLAQPHVDGISLLNALLTPNTALPERAFIMESGMLPNQFLNREQAKISAQKFFRVNKQSNHLNLRQHELATLDAMKLYAIIKGDWVLALYPDDHGYMPIVQRLTDGAWVDNLNNAFAKSSPAISMLNYAQQFYKKTLLIEQ